MKYQFAVVALLVSFEAFCQGQFQKESAGSLTYVSGQVMMLAQAIPGDKYSYHTAGWCSFRRRSMRTYYFSKLLLCLKAWCKDSG